MTQRQLHRLMSISEPLRAEWLKSLVGDLVEDLESEQESKCEFRWEMILKIGQVKISKRSIRVVAVDDSKLLLETSASISISATNIANRVGV